MFEVRCRYSRETIRTAARRGDRLAGPPTGRLCHAAGVTLIEILIVLAILALIAAVSIGGLMLLPEHAKAKATEALIAKLDNQLNQRLSAFNEQRNSVRALAVDNVMSGALASRAQVIAQKRAMRQQFPENFIVDCSAATPKVYAQWDTFYYPGQTIADLPPGALVYNQILQRLINDPARKICNHTPATARAECLYMILTAAGGGSAGVEGEAFPPGEVADTDEDGLPEFVDKWGNPIQFFLWPTHYSSPAQNPGSEIDAADPNQLLTESTAGSWWAMNRGPFENFYHSLTNLAGSAPQSSRTYPLIISAGPDGGFGLISYGAGSDGQMGTLDDPVSPGPDGTLGTADDGLFLDSRAIRLTNADQGGYGMDKDNLDNHHLRAR